jgi:hypothetical protein
VALWATAKLGRARNLRERMGTLGNRLIVGPQSKPNLAPSKSFVARKMPQQSPPCSTKRVERALLLLAYLIERDGDDYLPLYEMIENHLVELRSHEGARDRARRLLESYSRRGQTNAVLSKNLSFNSNEGPLPYLGLPER